MRYFSKRDRCCSIRHQHPLLPLSAADLNWRRSACGLRIRCAPPSRPYEDALALFREIGDKRGISIVLAGLAALALSSGDLDQAGAERLTARESSGGRASAL